MKKTIIVIFILGFISFFPISGKCSFNNLDLDYLSNYIPTADKQTFKILNDSFAIDKKNAYCGHDVITDADPNSFLALNNTFAKDKENAYYCGNTIEKINGADVVSFEVLSSYYSRDKNRVYMKSCVYDYCEFLVTPIDSATISVLSSDIARDKNDIYFVTQPLKCVDRDTFEALGEYSHYGKDKNRGYFFKKQLGVKAVEVIKLDEVDVNTFKMHPNEGAERYAVDKYFGYFDGKLKSYNKLPIKNTSLYEKLKGKVIIRPESKGEAFYISSDEKEMFFLSRPHTAFAAIRYQGIGIKNTELDKIPVFGKCPAGQSDCDKPDKYDLNFAEKQKGRIFIAVEKHGEAWYVNPANAKRYFLGRPIDAFNIMRITGLGISEKDFLSL
jgi:hypothetical protein